MFFFDFNRILRHSYCSGSLLIVKVVSKAILPKQRFLVTVESIVFDNQIKILDVIRLLDKFEQ